MVVISLCRKVEKLQRKGLLYKQQLSPANRRKPSETSMISLAKRIANNAFQALFNRSQLCRLFDSWRGIIQTFQQRDLKPSVHDHCQIWDHHCHWSEKCFQVVWKFRTAGIARVHGDENLRCPVFRFLCIISLYGTRHHSTVPLWLKFYPPPLTTTSSALLPRSQLQPVLAWLLPSNCTSPLQANEDVLQHMNNLTEDQGQLIRLCESLHGKVQSSKRNFSFSSFNAAWIVMICTATTDLSGNVLCWQICCSNTMTPLLDPVQLTCSSGTSIQSNHSPMSWSYFEACVDQQRYVPLWAVLHQGAIQKRRYGWTHRSRPSSHTSRAKRIQFESIPVEQLREVQDDYKALQTVDAVWCLAFSPLFTSHWFIPSCWAKPENIRPSDL